MLMDICTRAIQERSPEIALESSVRAYMTKRLGIGWDGGRNGQYTLFRKQAIALATCSMRFSVEQQSRVVQFQGMPIAQFEVWVDNEGDQRSLWPGKLRLSVEFYGSLIDHGLPIDMQAYHALSHSALAMDLYTFLAHRLWRIDGVVDISWQRLRDAMAPEYSRVRYFRQEFLKALSIAPRPSIPTRPCDSSRRCCPHYSRQPGPDSPELTLKCDEDGKSDALAGVFVMVYPWTMSENNWSDWYPFEGYEIGWQAPSDKGGVYYIADSAKNPVYVGKAESLLERLAEHEKGSSDQSACIRDNGGKFFRFMVIEDLAKRKSVEGVLREMGSCCNRN